MKDGQNILQLAIPLNASRTDEDCTVLLQRYGCLCYTVIWNDFFLDAATNQKERETFLAEPVSNLKLVCNLKYLSRKQFHKLVKGDTIFLGNLRYLQNIHELNRLSK